MSASTFVVHPCVPTLDPCPQFTSERRDNGKACGEIVVRLVRHCDRRSRRISRDSDLTFSVQLRQTLGVNPSRIDHVGAPTVRLRFNPPTKRAITRNENLNGDASFLQYFRGVKQSENVVSL